MNERRIRELTEREIGLEKDVKPFFKAGGANGLLGILFLLVGAESPGFQLLGIGAIVLLVGGVLWVLLDATRRERERCEEAVRRRAVRRGWRSRPDPLRFELQVSARETPRLRCAYCHDGLARDSAIPCGGCGATYHPECQRELRLCVTLGCARVGVKVGS